jgi:peroxiredoxin
MARTLTNQIPLGFIAPEFLLPDTVSGLTYRYADLRGTHGTVVVFICNHCPFVIHIIDELVKVANDYGNRGIGFIAISANDVTNYPDDHPDKMKTFALEHGFTFPYLYDEPQEVARAYDAACTPDFNVFDASDRCVYRGQFDGARPGNEVPVTGMDLRNALDVLLRGETPPADGQLPSVGCNIKWKQA